jgi:SagB-type dehydrogenase family enzyme
MANNRDISAAWNYHNRTKHSIARLQEHPHYLDWEIKPRPFKVYPDIEPIPLPRELPPGGPAALSAIAVTDVPVAAAGRIPDLTALARLLHFSAGITRKKVYPGGEEHYFRAAACTGALYHVDLYVICGDLPGLPAGTYHFGPHSFGLYRLRAGDHRGVLVEATGSEPSVQHAPVILACASTYWRNSWKYQARAYRHCFWDAGTILANLIAIAAADALPARVVCGFVDGMVSGLLGLDESREGPLALVALGYERATAQQPRPPAISLETLPLSAREVDYPPIRDMQAASSLDTPADVRAWRASVAPLLERPPVSGTLVPLHSAEDAALPADRIDQVILRRGSARRFSRRSIAFAQLSAVLERSTRGVSADCCGPPSDMVPNDLYLIVHAVDGLSSGTYVYHRERNALELLRAGSFRREAGYLALGQDLAADASVNIYVLCNLEAVLARFGNRGYRVAQLDAAITGGKVYLAAYALRLGATGLTFFDDDVTEFFSPHAAGKSVMFLVALGHGSKALAQVG